MSGEVLVSKMWLGLDYLITFHCRVPEIVYQPSMLGIEQAGIAETIDFILNHFHAELQTALVQVFAVSLFSMISSYSPSW